MVGSCSGGTARVVAVVEVLMPMIPDNFGFCQVLSAVLCVLLCVGGVNLSPSGMNLQEACTLGRAILGAKNILSSFYILILRHDVYGVFVPKETLLSANHLAIGILR